MLDDGLKVLDGSGEMSRGEKTEISNPNSIKIIVFIFFRNAANKIQNIIGMWFLICVIWSVVTEFQRCVEKRAYNLYLYKSSCVETGGKIRHDSWLLGIDVYCQMNSGDETVFYNESSWTLSKLLLASVDRATFNLLKYSNKI